MLSDYFENLTNGLMAKLEAAGDGPKARKRFALEIARLGSRLFSGRHGVAWCGVVAPYELLHAAGVQGCFVEFVGAMLASTGTAPQMLAEAEQAGYSTDSCAYHRSVLGAMEKGLVPEPDFVLATTAPCHGGLAVMEILATQFGKPFHVLQIPTGNDEDAVDRLASQLEDSVEFIAAVTGQRPSPEKIAQVIEASNRARALWKEVNELAAAVPTPQRPRDLINFGIVMNLFLGTEAAVEVARTYRDEFARRVERGEGGHPAERVRLMWLQNRIQFRSGVDEALAQMGAAVVFDELNHVFWDDIDPNRPYHGLARRMLSLPLCQSAQERARTLVELARLYRVQGAINPCHWGCRQGSGSRGIIQKILREAGIPVINLEVDCVDERNFSEGQLRTRLEAFCEMLGGN